MEDWDAMTSFLVNDDLRADHHFDTAFVAEAFNPGLGEASYQPESPEIERTSEVAWPLTIGFPTTPVKQRQKFDLVFCTMRDRDDCHFDAGKCPPHEICKPK